MISFKNFVIERINLDVGFVAVKPIKEHADLLISMANKMNLKQIVPKDELHCTLMYSRVPLNDIYMPCKNVHEVTLTGWGFLNYCFVVFLESASLRVRNNELKLMCGGVSDYKDYTPHITLSYKKQTVINDEINTAFQNYNLLLDNEYYDKLKE